MLEPIIANLGWGMADRVIQMAVALAVGIQVVRYLGPENYGIFAAGVAVIGMAQAVASLGLRLVVVRQLLDAPEDEPAILGSAAMLLAGSSLVSVALLGGLAASSLMEPEMAAVTAILSVSIMVIPLADTFRFRFAARLEEKYVAIGQSVALLVSAAIRIGLIVFARDLWLFAVALSLEAVIRGGLFFWFFHRGGGRMSGWKPRWRRVRGLLAESSPLLVAVVASTCYQKLDTAMLKMMAGNESAGIYGAAARLSEVFYFIPLVLGTSLLPSIFNARKRNPALYRRRLQGYLQLSAAIAYCLCAGVTLAGPLLVKALFGSAYDASANVLMIHAWAAVPFFLGWARQEFFTAEGMFRVFMPVSLGGALVNLLLNLWLIPVAAETGAAIATLISYILTYLVSSFLIKASREFGWMQLRSLAFPIPSLRNLSMT